MPHVISVTGIMRWVMYSNLRSSTFFPSAGNNRMLEKSFVGPTAHINLATAHYTARHDTLENQMSSTLQNIKSLRIPDRILNSIKKSTYILSLPMKRGILSVITFYDCLTLVNA